MRSRGAVDAYGSHGASKRSPVGDVLWIGDGEHHASTQRALLDFGYINLSAKLNARGTPRVNGQPEEIGCARDTDRNSEAFGLEQQADPYKSQYCPQRVTSERADLYEQCSAITTTDTLADRFCKYRTGRGVEDQAKNES